MNTKNKFFNFNNKVNEHIKSQQKIRRQEDAFLNQLLREADGWASEDPALGIDYLFGTVTKQRRLARRLLWSRFGFKVARIGPNPTAGRFVKPQRLPSSAEERSWCITMLSEWMAREAAFMRMSTVAREASRPDQDAFRVVRNEFRWGLRMTDTFKVGVLLLKSCEDNCISKPIEGQEWMAWFSGWVAAQISLQQNKRLTYSLNKGSTSAFAALLQELPATTLIELDALVREEKQASELVNRVAKALANVGSGTPEADRDKTLASSDLADVTITEPMLEAFSAKEKLQTLRASTQLSSREDQVLELMLKDHPDREIASKLEIGEGSVKTHKYRIRQKLRKAAGQ